MKTAFFSTHKFELPYLQAQFGDKAIFFSEVLSDHTVAMAQGFDMVSVFVNDDVNDLVLSKLHSFGVKGVLLRCAGFNHVDLVKAKELGIQVANVPAYSPYAVAEHTIALMLSLNRKIVRAHVRVREGNFSLDGLVGFDMNGKTVGLIGTGKIGKCVANILLGMGCKVLAHDPSPEQKIAHVEYVSLDHIWKESDIITLHCPLNSTTKYVINENSLELMKPGVMLINTGRGGLLDTTAVIDALKSKKIGYLGLDVYEEESELFFEDHSDDVLLDDKIARLMTFRNVLITSHQGFLTSTALTNIAETTKENFLAIEGAKEGKNELVEML